MKNCGIVLILLLFWVNSSAQWNSMNSGTTKTLVKGCFVSDSTGFVISNDGVVLKTTDLGTTWNQVAVITGNFTQLTNLGADTLFAAGTKLYRSTDGGNTWTYLNTFTGGTPVRDLIFFNSGIGYTVIPGIHNCYYGPVYQYWDEYQMFTTTNYGTSWHRDYSWDVDRNCHFQKVNDSVGYISGRKAFEGFHCMPDWINQTRKTTNKGNTWNPLPNCPLSFSSYFQQDTGYFVGLDTMIYKTVNGGQSAFTLHKASPVLTQMKFINNIDGYILNPHEIYVTRSEGFSWHLDYTSFDSLSSLFWSPAKYLFVCGANGRILRKQFIASTQKENVYSVLVPTSPLAFGSVKVNHSKNLDFPVTNNGNMPVDLTIKGSSIFRVGATGIPPDSVLTIHLESLQNAATYACFSPQNPKTYTGNLECSGDSLTTSSTATSGTGYSCFSGNINQITIWSDDTVDICGNINVNYPACLIISKGVVLRFLGDYTLKIKGYIEIQGDPHAPVRVISLAGGQKYFWGIQIIADTSYQSYIKYCNFTSPSSFFRSMLGSGKVIVDHCNFSGNNSLFAKGTAVIVLSNSVFSGSDSALVFKSFKKATISDCEILNCTFPVIISGNNTSDLIFERNLIHDNLFMGINASIYLNSPALGQGKLTIRNNRIFRNGGGVSADSRHGKLWIQNNEIFNNASYSSGGIGCFPGKDSCYITQNLVYNNLFNAGYGGGISLNQGLGIDTMSAVISGNTLCNNLAGAGKTGSQFYASSPTVPAKLNILDNIIYNTVDTGNVIGFSAALQNIILAYNCINQASLPGEHNISSDPLFVKPSAYTGTGTGLDSLNWAIGGHSPCINKGDSLPPDMQLPFDFAGNPRIIDHRIDIGAYECQNPLGVIENKQKPGFLLFPNPATKSVCLSYTGNLNGESILTLWDLNGKQLMTRHLTKQGSMTLDLGGLSKGIYILQIQSQAGIETKKLSIY